MVGLSLSSILWFELEEYGIGDDLCSCAGCAFDDGGMPVVSDVCSDIEREYEAGAFPGAVVTDNDSEIERWYDTGPLLLLLPMLPCDVVTDNDSDIDR
jgi:hypothetical protein